MFYIIFFVGYIISLSILRHRLKKFFPAYYSEQRKTFKITTLSLISSGAIKIFLRFQFLIVPGYREKFDESYEEDTWFAPLLLFFGQMLEYIPLLISILLSLRSNIKPDERS